MTLDSKKFYHLREWNYTPGAIIDFNIRSTETAVYLWTEYGEGIGFQIAPVGTTWSYYERDCDVIVAEIIANTLINTILPIR